jgi:hypothetical protein
VREILKEAGDAAVLEPEDARETVLAAVAKLRAMSVGVGGPPHLVLDGPLTRLTARSVLSLDPPNSAGGSVRG